MEHLIPEAWFQGLPQIGLLAIVAVGIAILGKAADILVEGASGLALRAGMPKIVVGATVVSLGTTSPECAVSVMAAWSGEPGLALGNAIGSIVADTGLIFGIGCLMIALPAHRRVLGRQGWVQFFSAVLLAGLCYGQYALYGDGAVLGRGVGLGFLGMLVLYMVLSVRWAREDKSQAATEALSDDTKHALPGTVGSIVRIIIGLGIVLLSSHVLILAVTELAEAHWHVPQVVIAATLVALGTSLPELVIGLTSVLKGHGEILVGNVVGADILNVLFVVGASATAAPLPIIDQSSSRPAIVLLVHLPAMLLILLLFRVFISRSVTGGHFRRWYGVPLVGLYLAYTILQYLLA